MSATLAATRAAPPNHSNAKCTLLLRRAADITQPVAVAKALLPHGLSLRKAHEVVNRLTANQAPAIGIPISLSGDTNLAKLTAELHSLGVHAIALHTHREVGARLPRLREQLGLTQDEFALLLDVELATLRNWEQQRTQTAGGPLAIVVDLLAHGPEAFLMGRT